MAIITTYDRKPGRMPGPRPFCFDWSATFDDYEPGDYIGYGSTEQEAIDDLRENADERDGDIIKGIGNGLLFSLSIWLAGAVVANLWAMWERM